MSALAAPVNANARYIVSLGGINFAKVKISLNDDAKNYNINLDMKISGVGSLVASGSATGSVSGISSSKGLTPSKLNIMTDSRGEEFNVSVVYSKGNAVGFQVSPPLINDIGRVAIERKDLQRVTDPIGSFILKGKGFDERLCNQKLKLFSGLERFDVKMKFVEKQIATSKRTAYQGPVILCSVRYIPVSGHYVDSAITNYLAKSNRFLIWYAPLGENGHYIPYRVIIGTSAGDLSMVLTGLKL
ncbi:MAG: DUF3108 domain-containing protein [Devosiaceae bacterium]|nr:DUF3108 domain-containing protein [Devosiaceae bacterium]